MKEDASNIKWEQELKNWSNSKSKNDNGWKKEEIE